MTGLPSGCAEVPSCEIRRVVWSGDASKFCAGAAIASASGTAAVNWQRLSRFLDAADSAAHGWKLTLGSLRSVVATDRQLEVPLCLIARFQVGHPTKLQVVTAVPLLAKAPCVLE